MTTTRKSPSGIRVGLDNGGGAAPYVGGLGITTPIPNVNGTGLANFISAGFRVADKVFSTPDGSNPILILRDLSPHSGVTAVRVTTLEIANASGVFGAPIELCRTGAEVAHRAYGLPDGQRIRLRTYVGITNATGYAGDSTTYGEETNGVRINGIVVCDPS